MYENGKNIYDTMNMFSSIPIQVHNDRITNLFNTDNTIRNDFLNDHFINELQGISNMPNNFIINHILDCLKPIIYQNKNYNMYECKTIITNTLLFKCMYMKDINTQLDFIFASSTINYIKDILHSKLPTTYQVKNVYIESVLKNQIDKHSKNNKEINSSNISVKYNVYINQATLFTEREVFYIIHNTIDIIVNKINSEYNTNTTNSKLDKWNTVLGHNNNDLTQNINIKLNTKRPSGMQFNMTY